MIITTETLNELIADKKAAVHIWIFAVGICKENRMYSGLYFKVGDR